MLPARGGCSPVCARAGARPPRGSASAKLLRSRAAGTCVYVCDIHTHTHAHTERERETHAHLHQCRRDRHTFLAKSCFSLDVRQPARAVSVSRRATSVDVSLTSPQPRHPVSEASSCLVKILKSQRPILYLLYKVTLTIQRTF